MLKRPLQPSIPAGLHTLVVMSAGGWVGDLDAETCLKEAWQLGPRQRGLWGLWGGGQAWAQQGSLFCLCLGCPSGEG